MKKLLLLGLMAIAGSLQTIRATNLEECELVLAERVPGWAELSEREREHQLINGLYYQLAAEEPYNLGVKDPNSPAAGRSHEENVKAMACLTEYIYRPGGTADIYIQSQRQKGILP